MTYSERNLHGEHGNENVARNYVKKNVSKEIKNIIIHNILENIPVCGDEMWSLTENFRNNTKGSCIRGSLQMATENIQACNVTGFSRLVVKKGENKLRNCMATL